MADIKPGSKINVLVDTEKEDSTITLVSSLEGFGDNKRLIITAPMQGPVLYPLSSGRQVVIQFFDKSAIIGFDAVVIQRIEQRGLSYLLLEQKSDFRRTQRRQDFRMECIFDGKIEYKDPTDDKIKKKSIMANDLSAGGAALRSDVGFTVGDEIAIHLPLGKDGETQRFPCVVRRCFRIDDPNASWRYNIGVQFLFEDNRQKENLVAQIFALERERRKREFS